MLFIPVRQIEIYLFCKFPSSFFFQYPFVEFDFFDIHTFYLSFQIPFLILHILHVSLSVCLSVCVCVSLPISRSISHSATLHLLLYLQFYTNIRVVIFMQHYFIPFTIFFFTVIVFPSSPSSVVVIFSPLLSVHHLRAFPPFLPPFFHDILPTTEFHSLHLPSTTFPFSRILFNLPFSRHSF